MAKGFLFLMIGFLEIGAWTLLVAAGFKIKKFWESGEIKRGIEFFLLFMGCLLCVFSVPLLVVSVAMLKYGEIRAWAVTYGAGFIFLSLGCQLCYLVFKR